MNKDSPDSLESPIPTDVRLDTPESRERLSQLLDEIDARYKSGHISDVPWLMRASEALVGYATNDEADARSRALSWIAFSFYHLSDLHAAHQVGMSSIALASQAGARSALRFALTAVGAIRGDRLDIGGALEAYAQALGLARELGEELAEGSVLINLGVALEYLGQYADALACHERALQIAMTCESAKSLLGGIYTNTAQCLEYMGRFEAALAAMESAISVTEEPRNTHELFGRVIRESCFTRLLLAAGRTAEAHEHFETARRYAQRADTDRARIEFGLLEGNLKVRTGNIEGGLAILEGLTPGLKSYPSARKQALLGIAEAHELAGRPERALASLWEYTDLMRGLYQNSIPPKARHAASAYVGELDEDIIGAEQLRRRESALRTQLAARDNSRAHLEMLERLAISSGLREDPSGEAPYRVGKLSRLLAAASGRDPATCDQIELAARLHDIGKAFIPDRLLLKPGRLSEAELEIVRSHAKEGAAFLAAAGFAETKLAEEIVLSHHERWDGSGYPRKLAKDGIPWSARVVALADSFDAMTHERPHARALPVGVALAEISADGGRQFDPELATRFMTLLNELRETHADLDKFLAEGASTSSLLGVRARIADALEASAANE
jgi:putative two-component system response regulator